MPADGEAEAARPAPISYVLPLRWEDGRGLAELASYVRRLAGLVDETVVVDASPAELFERHRLAFGRDCRHLRPHPELRYGMGKVNGVVTGVRESSNEKIVIADDDVRYGRDAIARVDALLDAVELVRPQNYFHPLVWHARWDTARTLLNRVFSGDLETPAADFPGTLAVRRSFFIAIGAYDGDVLFENLELIRTVRAAGGRVLDPLDLYVARHPPSTRHFLSQRVRQAYDDFALPLRMAAFLAAGPSVAAALLAGRRREVAAGAAAIVTLAELGRRRAGGRSVFPPSASLLAPGWVLERAICSWLALAQRVSRGGVRYGDGVLRRSATSSAKLRARYRDAGRTVAGSGSPGALSELKPTSL